MSERSGITAITIENFKGFRNPIRLALKPITLLFGANSAGKSTILQALQYMREVLERNNANPDRTLYGGDFVDLGGFRNLVHGRVTSKRIAVQVELALGERGLPDLVPESFDEWQNVDSVVWEFYELLQETRNRVETVSVRIEVAWSSVRNTAVVVGYHVGANGQWLAEINANDDGREVSMKINPQNPIFMREFTAEELAASHEILEDLGLDNTDVPAESAPQQTQYSVWQGITDTLLETGMPRPGDGLRSWLTGFDSALPRLGELLSIPVAGVTGADNIYIAREFTAFLSSLVIGPGVLMRDELRNLRYVGPIRHVPVRDFDAALTRDEARWADGLAGWEALLTGEQSLVDEVSHWMADEDKLNTGYEVERREVREIRSEWLALMTDDDFPPERQRLLSEEIKALLTKPRVALRETKSGLAVQPRDVGIGISQVLPVVVAALEPSASLVAIEQPELHIHPAVQVGLGDLFMRSVATHGMSFLIETHSEHLILRLLRRVRETTDGELPPGLPGLKPEDVGVVYVQSGEDGVELVELPIDARGKFLGRWPKGFFAERMREALPRDVREKVEGKLRSGQ